MITIDDLVIGSTSSAFQFCFDNSFHILLSEHKKYFFFDGEVGDVKKQLCSSLYVQGRVINHDPALSISIEDDVLSYFNGYKTKKIKFKNLYIFDFINVDCEGFVVEDKTTFYKVLDWVTFKTGGKHDRADLNIGERLLYNVHFFQNPLMSKGFKDAVIVSYMGEDEINDPDLSDSLMFLKFKQVLEEHGFKGKINRYEGERVFHLKPKFEIKKREKIEISRYKVQTPQNIKFYNSYYNEVINGRAKTILINTCFPLGWDNTDSETEV
tara:strand:- start:311 stop:1114 length:804 start_codon:yes stop_codon:yes gene_type:complete